MARHLSITKKLRTGMALNVAQASRLGVLNKAQKARLRATGGATPAAQQLPYNPYADAGAFTGSGGDGGGSVDDGATSPALDAAAAPSKWLGIALIGVAALGALYIWRHGGK